MYAVRAAVALALSDCRHPSSLGAHARGAIETPDTAPAPPPCIPAPPDTTLDDGRLAIRLRGLWAINLAPRWQLGAEVARALAAPEDQDCTQSTPTASVPTPVKDCAHFYEWNARCQITSWNPTPEGAKEVPDGPIDYAAKHWSGLIADYYAARVEKVQAAAMEDAAKGKPLDKSKFEFVKATHAFDFQVATKAYPLTPSADAVSV